MMMTAAEREEDKKLNRFKKAADFIPAAFLLLFFN